MPKPTDPARAWCPGRRAPLATAAAGLAGVSPNPRRARALQGEPVDVALVLAVDVSHSIGEDEARLQREGYRAAVADPGVVEAVRGGMMGAIGLAYVEWAGAGHQRLVLPWTRIASRADADAWAGALALAPLASLSQTSISGGIDFSRRALAAGPFEAARRVIDVSGDGANNSGPPAGQARDRAVAEGITVNGLPIVTGRPTSGGAPQPLDDYYRACPNGMCGPVA